MTDQSQDVGEGGSAIQSGRDTTINYGITPAQMVEILAAIRVEISAYEEAARHLVDKRVAEFGERLTRRFAEGNEARHDAFADPDFQMVVREAQRAHARAGDDGVLSVLVDLIARRSTEISRTRMLLCLNQAIEKAALLSHEDYAVLTLCYMLRYVSYRPQNFEGFVEFIDRNLMPHARGIAKGTSVLSYLDAQGCGSLSTDERHIIHIMHQNYAGMICDGINLETFNRFVEPDVRQRAKQANLLKPSLHNPENLQMNALTKQEYAECAKRAGLKEYDADQIWARFNLFDFKKVVEVLRPRIPDIETLADVWRNAHLDKLTLTPVGIAIAHASAQRLGGFAAPLSIWIK